MDNRKRLELEQFAATIRIETIKTFKKRGFGHVGGAMSVVELLAVLYSGEMRIDPSDPNWEHRDRLVMSKGHAGPSVYATLALKGYFPMEWLETLNIPGTHLPSHCDRNRTPGVDMTTGSLGQGISTAAGMALGFKLDSKPNRVFAVIGDGECDEGQIWEGALFCAHHELDNMILFIDVNKKQLDGYTDDILKLGDLAAKFTEFGWHCLTVNGQDVAEIAEAIEAAREVRGKPSCIVMNTTKGAGFREVAETMNNHHIVVSPELADRGIAEQQAVLENLRKEA